MDKLGISSAAAQAPGYKALVCVFMFGGNDASNMVMPLTNYDVQYLPSRPVSTGINIPKASLLTINPVQHAGARNTGCTRRMPELQNLFERRQVRDPVQRRHAVRTDHAGAVHLVQARRQEGPGQPLLAQRPAAAVHVDDEQRHAREDHGLGRPPRGQGRRTQLADGDADVDVVLRLADLRQRRHGTLALAADWRQLRLLGRRRERAAGGAGCRAVVADHAAGLEPDRRRRRR